MLQLGLESKIPYDKFKAYLEEGNLIYIDENKIRQAQSVMEAQSLSRLDQLTTAVYGISVIKYPTIKKQTLIDYLIDYGVPEKYFMNYGRGDAIYYNQKVRDKIIANEMINDVFLLQESHSKLKNSISKIKNIIARAGTRERTVGNEGERLIPIPYKIAPNKNLRFSTIEENVIQFNGAVRDSFTAPEDFYILGADFPQIDGRAALYAYLKNDLLTNIMSNVDDAYLAFKEYARHVDHEFDKKELEDSLNADYYQDKTALEERINKHKKGVIPFASPDVRNLYKVVALKTVYYSRYSAFKVEQREMNKLARMLESSERYKRILAIATTMFNYNVPIEVKSRWGHKRLILEDSLNKSLSSLFNAPIQTTSSEVIICYVVHFLDYFRQQGIGPEDVRICLNRHDEPLFYIRKSVYEQHVRFIAGMRTVLVEGWEPIKLNMYVGNSYKRNDKYAYSLLESVPPEHERALTIAQKFKDVEEPYPLLEPMIIHLESMKMDNDVMRVAITWHEGKLGTGVTLDKHYKDTRTVKVKILSFNTAEQEMNNDLTVGIVQQFSNMIEHDQPFLVFANGVANQDLILEKRTAYFRNVDGKHMHYLAKGVLAAAKKKENPEGLGVYENQMIAYLEKYKGEFS